MSIKFPIEAGFLGPKAEHGNTWSDILNYILQDYIHWRRNYFPEDEQIIDRGTRRSHEAWFDTLSNSLDKVLNKLKADYPFYSPRYQGHMVSENLVSGLVGYFAGMLYNPNNVSSESAPITLNLELEVGKMISTMLGYGPQSSWSHITSGGTIANMEAIWAARQNQLNGVAFQEVCIQHKIPFIIEQANGISKDIREIPTNALIGLNPQVQIKLPYLFKQALKKYPSKLASVNDLLHSVKYGKYSITHHGMHSVYSTLGVEPVLLASQAAHYSIRKIANILGIGEKNVIFLPVDKKFRVDMDAFRSTIEGLSDSQPIISAIGILGTTEEGAIDPIHEMLRFRKQYEQEKNKSFWFHVDAAWGGYLKSVDMNETCISPHLKEALNALSTADSITIDPHKMGYIPYPAGVICFKNKYAVLHSHQVAPYITLSQEAPDPLDVNDLEESVGPYIIEGSKPGAAAVAAWLTHKTIPLTPEGHGKLIKASLENANRFYENIEQTNQLENSPVKLKAIGKPDCNVLCYYFTLKDNHSLDLQNKLNQQVFRAFSLANTKELKQMPYRQEYFISHTHFFPSHYPFGSVAHLLDEIDSAEIKYKKHGLFILRSVIINPWLDPARNKGTDHLQGLITKLYQVAVKEYEMSMMPGTDRPRLAVRD